MSNRMDTVIANIPTIGVLYKLVVGENYYIGSSIDTLSSRLSRHYKTSRETPDRKLYKAVGEGGGWANVKVEVIETLVVLSKQDLWKREDEYIRLDDPKCLNTLRAILTPDERRTQLNETKRRCWKKWMEDPEFAENQRQKKREFYQRNKTDPEFLEKKREIAKASYHRRKKADKETSG